MMPKGCRSRRLEVPLPAEREETIGVTRSKIFENLFAFSDIKPLKLQAINDFIAKPIQRLAPP